MHSPAWDMNAAYKNVITGRLECMINNDSKRVTYGEKGSPEHTPYNTSAACLDFCEVCETGKKFKYMLLLLDRPRVKERERERKSEIAKPAGESFWKWNLTASRLTDFCLVLRSASTGVASWARAGNLPICAPWGKIAAIAAVQIGWTRCGGVWCRSQDLKMGKFSES